jgi:hypothetical protein
LCVFLYFCHGCDVGVVVRDVATELSTCDNLALACGSPQHVTRLLHHLDFPLDGFDIKSQHTKLYAKTQHLKRHNRTSLNMPDAISLRLQTPLTYS